MANEPKDGNQQLGMLPLTPKNGGVRILGKRFQDYVLNFINACRVTRVVIPINDGTTSSGVKYADVKSTALGGTVITFPAGLIGVGGSSGASIGGVNAQTTNYTAISGDNGKLISFNSASALTLTLPATAPSSTWLIGVECVGAGGLTIDRNGHNIDGTAANLTLAQNEGLWIFTDGTNWFSLRATTASAVQMFAIKTLSNADYYVARTWDGTTLGSSDIYVAKPVRQRTSITSEVIDGVTVNYSSYTSDNTRTANDGTNSEYQVVFPRFKVYSTTPSGLTDYSVVFAVKPIGGTGITVSGTPVLWLEIAPARVWARRYVQ